MRLDKFLQVSRLIKRRTVAKDFCTAGKAKVNDRAAKPGTDIGIGDTIGLTFGRKFIRVEVLELTKNVRKENAASLYQVIEERIEEDELDW